MAGRRFHRTTEVIPRRPWKSKSPFASKPAMLKWAKSQGPYGCARGAMRYFLHSFPLYGPPVIQSYRPPKIRRKSHTWKRCPQMEDRFLYSGGTDSLENFTAEFTASAPVVYKNPPPMGPEMLYTTGAGEGVKVSMAIFPSNDGGASNPVSEQRWCLQSMSVCGGGSHWFWRLMGSVLNCHLGFLSSIVGTGGMLFREENSLSLTERRGKLGEFWEKNSVSSLWHTNNRLSSVRAKKLTGFGVWNRTLRNRIRPVSEIGGWLPWPLRRHRFKFSDSCVKFWRDGPSPKTSGRNLLSLPTLQKLVGDFFLSYCGRFREGNAAGMLQDFSWPINFKKGPTYWEYCERGKWCFSNRAVVKVIFEAPKRL